MLSSIFKFVGQVVGETVHQTSELVNGTGTLIADIATDVANIPQAFVDGYNQELFEAKSTESTEPTTVTANGTAA